MKELRRFSEALASYERALALQPDLVNAHYGLSLCCLLIGDFARGWQKHEWRWETDLRVAKRHFVEPLWLGAQNSWRPKSWRPEFGGEDIAGKTILLHAEQGFRRHAPILPLRASGGGAGAHRRPGSACGAARADAHAAMPGPDRFSRHPLPAFDMHCPLLSLPLAFGPGSKPYRRTSLICPRPKLSRARGATASANGEISGWV